MLGILRGGVAIDYAAPRGRGYPDVIATSRNSPRTANSLSAEFLSLDSVIPALFHPATSQSPLPRASMVNGRLHHKLG